MKILNKLIKITCVILFFIFSFLFLMIYLMGKNIDSNYKVNRGEKFKIQTYLPVTAVYSGAKQSGITTHNVGDTYSVELKMFGVIPFSTTTVEVVDNMSVAVLGNPFGMKVYTDGVLVIEQTDFETPAGTANPSKDAGIKKGDYIVSVNGKKITCNEDLSDLVLESDGGNMKFEILRNNTTVYFNVKPIRAKDGAYKIGLWVRDSSAGIGTLTFFDPASNIICGLGHSICDNDTGKVLTVDFGEMVGANVVSITKGNAGSPGELKGKFTFDTLADIIINAENGVYGNMKGKIDISYLTEVSLKQDVEDGEAQILCTVDGNKPELYSCTIKKRNQNYNSKTQNFIITVTDERLIEKTGGIVQGMSGSPILQNGRLVGAITHVLIDDPKTGYGIFAENMLKTAQSVANENKLKDAS